MKREDNENNKDQKKTSGQNLNLIENTSRLNSAQEAAFLEAEGAEDDEESAETGSDDQPGNTVGLTDEVFLKK